MNLSILNREFKHPADGWYQIEAKGFHPCVGQDESGAKIKVVQVVDDKAITSIVNRFNQKASGGQLSHGFEMLIDREHFKDNPEKETVAYGWAKKLRASPDGSGYDVEKPWTKTGQQSVDGGDYRFFSTEYDGPTDKIFEPVTPAEVPVEIRNRYKDFIFLRPLELTGLTLTNAHNNKGQKAITITNREKTFAGTVPVDSTVEPNNTKKMKTVCTLLGLSADADEASVHAAVAKLQNRITTLEPLEADNTKLKNRLTDLEGESCESLMDAHGLDAEKDKSRREKLKPVLVSLKNREERAAFLKECCPVEKPAPQTRSQVKLHNRDTKPPGAAAESESDEQAKALKIQNRATELQGKGMKFADAFSRATTEFHNGQIK